MMSNFLRRLVSVAPSLAGALAVLAASPSLPAVTFTDETMTLVLEKYAIEHQGPQVIDLVVTLHFETGIANEAYPEVTAVYRRIEKLIKEYPNETDWCEIFNKGIAASLLASYPMAEFVSIDLSMHPTFASPYPNRYRCVARR